MTARRWPTIALALALPATAVAQPSLTIDGCGFEPDELLRALAQEGAPALAVDVRCTAAATACRDSSPRAPTQVVGRPWLHASVTPTSSPASHGVASPRRWTSDVAAAWTPTVTGPIAAPTPPPHSGRPA